MTFDPKNSMLFRRHPMMIAATVIACGLPAVVTGQTLAYGSTNTADAAPTSSRQYTFAWPYADVDTMKPRGGTSKGPPPALKVGTDQRWRDLQNASSTKAKDRAAILAMAGSYRASFDFLEVAGFTEDHKPTAPYQSWGTEKIVVLNDSPNVISLQHILVMRFVDDEGKISKPIVTKHWRQDWQFESRDRFDYVGQHQWRGSDIEPTAGTWSQCVYQVDDSPRYCGVGRWEHQANYSTWLSDEGARPLPRREWSVRSDYTVLIGTNRHTITPTGWIHEQQNNKWRDHQRSHLLAREFGFNRYERIDEDLQEADRYLSRTEPLWRLVREHWARLLKPGNLVSLKAAPDQGALFLPLFERAEVLHQASKTSADTAPPDANEVAALINAYMAEGSAKPVHP